MGTECLLNILIVCDNKQLDVIAFYPDVDVKRTQAGGIQTDQDTTATALHQRLGSFDDLRHHYSLPPRSKDLLAGIGPRCNRIHNSSRKSARQRRNLLAGAWAGEHARPGPSEAMKGQSRRRAPLVPVILPGFTATAGACRVAKGSRSLNLVASARLGGRYTPARSGFRPRKCGFFAGVSVIRANRLPRFSGSILCSRR